MSPTTSSRGSSAGEQTRKLNYAKPIIQAVIYWEKNNKQKSASGKVMWEMVNTQNPPGYDRNA